MELYEITWYRKEGGATRIDLMCETKGAAWLYAFGKDHFQPDLKDISQITVKRVVHGFH